MSWTDEKVEKLKELWGKGNTASQIAEIIGGISRNAVIGKAHRLNLSAKIKTRSAIISQSSKLYQENNKIKPQQTDLKKRTHSWGGPEEKEQLEKTGKTLISIGMVRSPPENCGRVS